MMSSDRARSALESFVVAAGRSPVVAVLGLGLLISLVNAGARLLDLPWRDHALPLSAIGVSVLLLFEAIRRISIRPAPLPVAPFLLASLALGLGLRLVYVAIIEPEWYTDFLRYWEYGVDLASGQRTEIDNVYSRRANFLTRPLIELFGPHRIIVPVCNALLLTLIQGLGYDILRRVRSHQAGQGFSLLWMAVPVPMMTMAVPNHDLGGLLLISIAIWLGVIAQRRHARISDWIVVACWVAAGIALALLQAVRGLGTLYLICLALLTLAAVVVVACRRTRPGSEDGPVVVRSVIGLLVIALSFVTTESALRQVGAVTSSDAEHYARLRYTTPHATSLSNGSYSFMSAFEKAFTRDLHGEPERFAAFRRSLVLTDFAEEPTDRVQASLARMQRQYSLGSQQGFYLRGVPGHFVAALSTFNIFFGAGFAIMLLLAMHRLLQHRARLPTVDHFLLLLTAIISLALLLVGENQSRYLSVLWLAGALVIPSQLSFRDPPAGKPLSPAWLLVSSAAILLGVLTTAWLMASWFFTPARGQILHDWTFSTDTRSSDVARNFFSELQGRESHVMISRSGKPVGVRFNELSLKLMLPAPPALSGSASAQQEVCGLTAPAGLEFQYDAPTKHIAGDEAFSLRVDVNDRQVWQAFLPNPSEPKRVRTAIPVDSEGCAQVRFTLVSHGDASRESWQRASFVEIFFPRIVAPPARQR
ncbi:MAG: glycosyltransferase family 39 protein [Lysobacter sp.]